jgi:hypothetical protein
MLLEAVKLMWQVVLRKEEQNEGRLCKKHGNINSQRAANSVVFFLFVGKV